MKIAMCMRDKHYWGFMGEKKHQRVLSQYHAWALKYMFWPSDSS